MDEFNITVKDLLEKILHIQSNELLSEFIERLFDKVECPEQHTKIQDSEVEEYVLQLWNWAVTRNVGSSINEQQRAKVRHIACRLLYLCQPENPSENTIRKQILMAIKTGRTWLDCKNPKLADVFFCEATTSLKTLYYRRVSQKDEIDDNLPKGDAEKDLLRVLSYKAESALSQENQQEAVSCVDECKKILLRLPNETGYLSLICYKFGVNTYNQKKLEDSSFWLRMVHFVVISSESYDIGKLNPIYSPEPEIQAKVLRLLAKVYLELDSQKYQDKALHAVSQANKECLHPAGIYLKIHILLKCGTSDEIVKTGLKELLDSEVQLHVCLSTVKLLIAEDREILAFDFLKTVSQHFESSPEVGTALLLHIELLLKRGKELLAKQKIEDAITGHYKGRQLLPQNLTSLHLLLWDRAAKNIEAKNYYEAVQWYNYSLSFYKAGELDQNLSKLQRNRASCFLYLQQLEKAKEAISDALKCDPNNIFTHFTIYKIAVLENNIEKAAEAIEELCLLAQMPVAIEDRVLVTENAAGNLLSLAAQIALDNKRQDTAMKALERVCEVSHDVVQVLTALRCLVRLVLSAMEKAYEENRDICLDALLLYLKMALKNVSEPRNAPAQGEFFCSDEANWFRRIAWNTALQCGGSSVRMRDFFLLCYQLSELCVQDRGVLMCQKTCLLMIAAACLDICCTTPQTEQQTEILTQALEHIQICWEVWRVLKATGDYAKDPTETLLLLYEFESRAKLNDPKLETVFMSILELHNVDTKILETAATLAMKPPAYFPVVCKKALTIALSLHKQGPQADLERCIYCLHTLIQLSLPSGVCEVEAHILEEVWGYYEEALSIISAAADDFPEVEILWLLTRAWNTGILLYSLSQFAEAEKWCGLGISFLQHLGSMQDIYQTQMSGLYGEVLDRLDKAKKNFIMEE